ncbi:hypothetical protein [uncultured Novosphingobium sp.]|uniref:hypothetical protein n=1 Tax=uncultured Novosphingobium sp. TaxID=292277 RepID=UPI003749F335
MSDASKKPDDRKSVTSTSPDPLPGDAEAAERQANQAKASVREAIGKLIGDDAEVEQGQADQKAVATHSFKIKKQQE